MLLRTENLWLSLKKRLQKIGLYQLTEKPKRSKQKIREKARKGQRTQLYWYPEAIKMNWFRLVMLPSIVHFILFWAAWVVYGSSECLEIRDIRHMNAERSHSTLSVSLSPESRYGCIQWMDCVNVTAKNNIRISDIPYTTPYHITHGATF